MRSKFICSIALLCAYSAVAQKAPIVNTPPPATETKPTTVTAPLAPKDLDELNRTRLDLISEKIKSTKLELGILNKNGHDLDLEMQQRIIAIEAQYPGYTVSMQTGQLVPKGSPEAQRGGQGMTKMEETPEQIAAQKAAIAKVKAAQELQKKKAELLNPTKK